MDNELGYLIERLGVSDKEMAELRVQEAARSLPGGYPTVEYVLGRRLLEKQNEAFSDLNHDLHEAFQRQKTYESRDEFVQKVRSFLQAL